MGFDNEVVEQQIEQHSVVWWNSLHSASRMLKGVQNPDVLTSMVLT